MRFESSEVLTWRLQQRQPSFRPRFASNSDCLVYQNSRVSLNTDLRTVSKDVTIHERVKSALRRKRGWRLFARAVGALPALADHLVGMNEDF